MRAEYNTAVSVICRDGTMRDVAVCASDTPEEIGRRVIEAIHGQRLYQYTVLTCGNCRGYMTGHDRLGRWARSAV